MAVSSTLILLILNFFYNISQADNDENISHKLPGYNLSSPDKIYKLPYILKEISGITELDDNSIACIQDEDGILFIYDLIEGQISKQSVFYGKSDFEGIARADRTIYVIRSDGMLFEIDNYETKDLTPSYLPTGIKDADIEGLCFDKKDNRLLIAPKNITVKGAINKDKRFIYAFDLKAKRLIEQPAFIFDLADIKKFARENKVKVKMEKSSKKDKKVPVIEFRTSAIGINPVTKRLFVISGVEKLLFVFDMSGKIEYIGKLDSDIYNQPEGITFLMNGDMLISNENKNNFPTIVRLNYSGE